jgi:hypothetical protein
LHATSAASWLGILLLLLLALLLQLCVLSDGKVVPLLVIWNCQLLPLLASSMLLL